MLELKTKYMVNILCRRRISPVFFRCNFRIVLNYVGGNYWRKSKITYQFAIDALKPILFAFRSNSIMNNITNTEISITQNRVKHRNEHTEIIKRKK